MEHIQLKGCVSDHTHAWFLPMLMGLCWDIQRESVQQDDLSCVACPGMLVQSAANIKISIRVFILTCWRVSSAHRRGIDVINRSQIWIRNSFWFLVFVTFLISTLQQSTTGSFSWHYYSTYNTVCTYYKKDLIYILPICPSPCLQAMNALLFTQMGKEEKGVRCRLSIFHTSMTVCS